MIYDPEHEPLLIIESSKTKKKLIFETSVDMSEIVESDHYILEGVFTTFDSRNTRQRIYTVDDYQPHIEKLTNNMESTIDDILCEIDKNNRLNNE